MKEAKELKKEMSKYTHSFYADNIYDEESFYFLL